MRQPTRASLRAWLAVAALFLVGPSHAAADDAPSTAPVDFNQQVAPILIKNCVRCHNASEASGELNLTQRESVFQGGQSEAPAITPGSVQESYLLDRLEAGEMPPEGKGKPLAEEDVALLRTWTRQGADWPDGRVLSLFEFTTDTRAGHDWWSLQPPVRPAIPETTRRDWVRTPVDAFVLAKLEREHLSPAPEADRATLIRRATFDLIGLPPAPEDIDQFVADASPDAYEKLVDHLLASPQYGERWGRHWLDVVRFGESNGYETNTARPNAWPYRDYVIRALNEDRPYPQFILEQLAGDQSGEDAATGFLVGGAHDVVASPNVELTLQQRVNDLDDMLSTASLSFLGLTVGCAKCHDHKFDAIAQRDYYALQAVFAGVQHGERELRPTLDDRQRREQAEIQAQLAAVEQETQSLLARTEPLASLDALVWIDDLAPQSASPNVRGVTVLSPPVGTTRHTPGAGRGQLDDPGDADRPPNLGQGYTYWHEVANTDVFAWNPAASGDYRIWLSWGCGWNAHAADAQYVLDLDGDLATRDDQTVIATVDHRKFADGTGDMPAEMLWSGFFDAGVHALQPTSRIVLRGGATDAHVTADVLLFEPVAAVQVAGAAPARSATAFGRPAVHPLGNTDRFAPTRARYVRFTVLGTNQFEPCLDELEIFAAEPAPRNVALASGGGKPTASSVYANGTESIHQLAHINDGRYGNGRSWISAEPGAGWVQIGLPQTTTIDRVSWARDREGKFRDRLATRYKIEVAESHGDWKVVATGDDRRPYDPQAKRTSGPSLNQFSPSDAAEFQKLRSTSEGLRSKLAQYVAQMTYVGTFAAPPTTYRLHRGEPQQKREKVSPGTVASVGNPLALAAETPEAERRLALARWLGDPANPLTARVMVNRLWHYHFGQGLIRSPNDFGFHAGQPSHPEMLDWLATEFMAEGWRLKALHREIVLSSTYRQSSRFDAAAAARDSGNAWLWRFSPRRLEAEPIRDAMLSASGVLDQRMAGPGYDAFEPNDNYVKVYTPKQKFGPAEWRRMIYQNKPRMRQDGVFGEFDCPDSSQSMARRNVSTTALQALNLLNGAFVVEQSELFAARLQREAPGDPTSQVRRAFRLAFGRQPADDELNAALKLIEDQGLPIFCRALFNANELIYIE